MATAGKIESACSIANNLVSKAKAQADKDCSPDNLKTPGGIVKCLVSTQTQGKVEGFRDIICAEETRQYRDIVKTY
jgi:hypothetical protein